MHVLQRTIAVEAKIKKIRIENVLTKLKKFWNIWWFSCTHLVCRERLLLCFVSFVGRAERAWTVDFVKEYYNFLKVRFAICHVRQWTRVLYTYAQNNRRKIVDPSPKSQVPSPKKLMTHCSAVVNRIWDTAHSTSSIPWSTWDGTQARVPILLPSV